MRQTSDSATILDECIERMRHGESMDSCLHDYPEQAMELVPMLMAAGQLELLARQRLTDAQRGEGKARMRWALASTPQRPPARAWLDILGLGRGRGLALAGMLSLVLAIALGSVAVASQPGDLAYPVRVLVERWPAQLTAQPATRAEAELATAERRLRELGGYLPEVALPDLTALDAAVWGVEAAAAGSASLAEPQRQHLAEQVSHQARTMAQLAAGAADDATRVRLQLAARWSLALAERLRAGQGPHGRWPDVDHLLPPSGGPESPAPELPAEPGRRTPAPVATAVGPVHDATHTSVPPRPSRTAPKTSVPTAAPKGPTLAPRPSEPASQPSPVPQPTVRPPQPTPGGPERGPGSGAGSGPDGQPTAPPAVGASPQPPEIPTSAPGPPAQATSPGATSPGPDPEPPGQGPGQAPGPGNTSP